MIPASMQAVTPPQATNMLGFHVRPEGGILHQGVSVYPWAERRHNFGFILKIGKFSVWCRWANHVEKFYFSIDC